MIKNSLFRKKNIFLFFYITIVSIPLIILFYKQLFVKKELIFRSDTMHYVPFNISSNLLPKTWVKLEKLPEGLVLYLIAVEDKRFYRHGGISLRDIQNVLFEFFVLDKKIRGASTITQQLSRTLFLEKENSVNRKWKEICIAVALEKVLSKDEILEYYLNTVYWGSNIYGIEKASFYYFQKTASKLEKREWEFLINILKKPNFYL